MWWKCLAKILHCFFQQRWRWQREPTELSTTKLIELTQLYKMSYLTIELCMLVIPLKFDMQILDQLILFSISWSWWDAEIWIFIIRSFSDSFCWWLNFFISRPGKLHFILSLWNIIFTTKDIKEMMSKPSNTRINHLYIYIKKSKAVYLSCFFYLSLFL